MNPYDESLKQMLNHLLLERHCELESELVGDKLIMLLQHRLRDIAVRTSSAANYAGRSSPCYFDVERTFQQLGIRISELQALRSERQTHALQFAPLETQDENLHQTPDLDVNQQRGARSGRHIPKYLPPYPSVHTYKQTRMDLITDRGYVAERERRAQHRSNTQRALNKFYLRTQPTASLFNSKSEQGVVLQVQTAGKPAYLSALMPQDEIFDVDIYEFVAEPLSEKAQGNSFLREAVTSNADRPERPPDYERLFKEFCAAEDLSYVPWEQRLVSFNSKPCM
ncbi:transcription initiation factor TFIID subunit 8 isoform X2 [Drosophila busckii]|uniref:transcription initiation factor TFIID subunit 8 isoform X2 n=1 Tax=Drosophila busckii TaxID=30019 RepID=UPI00083F2878|nr:transcription initiation factor TFIID subunit 8 isoform X2 [Drosophila busckii]